MGPAVQNPRDVDVLECGFLVNDTVAEEPRLPSSDSVRAAEQCQRGPRRLRLQFTGSQATTVSARRDAPSQFESPATSAAHVAVESTVVNFSDYHEASPNVHSERGASEWSGEEHVSEPGLGEGGGRGGR